MNNIGQKADNVVGGILLIGCMPSLIILICIIALFRSCMGYGEITIDNSYMRNRYEYDRAYIKDSLGNGYEVLWYTAEQVTEARYKELQTRNHIRASIQQFKESAANHFNHDLINTDIYDFVEYAKTFDISPDTVRIVNIWAYGIEYKKLYLRPHSDYPNGWRDGDKDDMGVLYLKEVDIYPYNFEAPRRYRYWNCDATSLTDERHTHITRFDR